MANDGNLGDTWVILRVASVEYALPVQRVAEVLRMVALMPLPEAPAWVVGMLNLRGTGMPVIDLRLRTGVPARPVDLNTPIVVLEMAGAPLGLIADEVVEIRPVSSGTFKAVDRTPGASGLVTALAHVDDRLIFVLDLGRLATGLSGSESVGSPHVAV